jgi:hypothetical protein
MGRSFCCSSNGHILSENLVNVERSRKLSESECNKYAGDFWEASSRLKLHDRGTKDQKQLQGQRKKATRENLEAQSTEA